MEHYKLRLGTREDLDELFAIYMDKTVNPYLSFEIMDKSTFAPIFDELFQSGQLYVFEGPENIVATCIVKRHTRRAKHVATLSTLATHPNMHGKGIGTRFMQEVFEKLKAEGIKRIDLWAEEDNTKALRFYQKMGFQLEGVMKKYFLRQGESKYIDEHIMAILLED